MEEAKELIEPLTPPVQEGEIPSPAELGKTEPAIEPPPPPPPAPKPVVKPLPQPKPVVKPLPPPEIVAPPAAPAEQPKKASGAAPAVDLGQRFEAELKFYESSFETAAPELLPPLLEQVDAFFQHYREVPGADQALFLRSVIREKQGDLPGAAVDILKLLYEYPQTKLAFNSKRKLLDIADKRLKKQKAALTEIAKAPVNGLALPARSTMLLRSLVDIPEPLLYAPVAAELREFLVRYPDLPESGEITILLGRHYFRNEAHRPAILIEQKVLALYKDPALLAKAQYQIGDIYATALKDFNKAVEAYQSVAEKYPETPEAASSYVRIAKILDENLNQSALAVEKLEEIVKLYPKTEAAHDAYLETARIQKGKLNAANKAVTALEALADMFPGDRAVSALKQAAEISDGLKDYASEARIYEKLAESTPQDKFAPDALWEAADVYEKKLLDPSAARKALEKLVGAHPSSKLFKKAQKRLQAMNK